MKRFIFLIYLFPVWLQAQNIPVASAQQYKDFLKTTTYFVSYDAPFSSYNSYIPGDALKVWTLTPMKSINNDTFENLATDKTNSFVFLSEAEFNNKGTISKFNVLNIVLGSRAGNMNTMPDLGSVPLSYVWEDEDDEDTYLYKIPGILRFFQYIIRYNSENTVSDARELAKKNKNLLEGKTLYLLREEMGSDVDSEEEISKYFKGNVKFVTKEEIHTAALNGEKDIVFLHKVGPGKRSGYLCIKFLISASDGAPVYFDMHNVSDSKADAFLSSDFKNL